MLARHDAERRTAASRSSCLRRSSLLGVRERGCGEAGDEETSGERRVERECVKDSTFRRALVTSGRCAHKSSTHRNRGVRSKYLILNLFSCFCMGSSQLVHGATTTGGVLKWLTSAKSADAVAVVSAEPEARKHRPKCETHLGCTPKSLVL